MENCVLTIGFVPQDACGNSEKTGLQECIAAFFACEPLIEDGVKKLRSSGFFGMMDKSNCAANDINDKHYLLFYLTMIWNERYNDATYNCHCCRFSKHPLYYLDKYKLCCIYEYFKCKGIDISCYLKAFQMDRVLSLTGISLNPINNTSYAYDVSYPLASQFDICVASTTDDTTAQVDSGGCCTPDEDAPAEEVTNDSPELITNGTFDTDLSHWSVQTITCIIWDNHSAYSNDNGELNPTIKQFVNLVSGKRYRLCFTISDLVNCNIRVNAGSGNNVVEENGRICYEFVSLATGPILTFQFRTIDVDEGAATGRLDDVTLKEINCCIDGAENQDCLWLFNHLKAL